MKYKVKNSKMQQNEQRHKQSWPNICKVPVIIPILNIFMSKKASVLLSWERGCHLSRISELIQ
jgi:L-rhamnose mutarotase